MQSWIRESRQEVGEGKGLPWPSRGETWQLSSGELGDAGCIRVGALVIDGKWGEERKASAGPLGWRVVLVQSLAAGPPVAPP